MNKVEREKLIEEVDIFAPRYVNEMLLKLTKYVDTLEAAAREVVTFSDFHGEPEPLASLAERLREALDKGK